MPERITGFKIETKFAFPLSDPRIDQKVIDMPVALQEPLHPDEVNYPQWELIPMQFPEESGVDGCLFVVGAGTATPVGLVGDPPAIDSEEHPQFTEYIVEGSGMLLITDGDGKVAAVKVEAGDSQVFQYGPGTQVAYIAGEKGLVGVNIGRPPQIPEDILSPNDPRITDEMKSMYQYFENNPL